GFTDLGLDSLTTIELTHQLQQQVPQSLPNALLYSYPTIATLSEHLLHLLEPQPSNAEFSTLPLEKTIAVNQTENEPLHEISNASENGLMNESETAIATRLPQGIAQLTEAEAEALLLRELDRLNP
ncbi:MAG: hypothetical protein D6742_18970, partial [Cyanobacteria bacterium J069]